MEVNRTPNRKNAQQQITPIKPANSSANSFSKQLNNKRDNLDNATGLAIADMSGKISQQDLNGGKQAMDGMMNIIREAASATGAADDGNFSKQEVLGMNSWIRENRLPEWTAFHGDDEGNSETGFHKWQGDGGKFQYNGDNFVNTVLDGINHLGFEYDGKNFLNEDGDANANLTDMTDWLNTAYFGDFAPGITIAQDNGGAEKAEAAEQAEAPEAANEAEMMTGAEQASGFSIADGINSFPEWLLLLAMMLGITPEELKSLLQGVLNEDGTIDKDKLAAKLVEKGMDPEMAEAYATKMADSFDKLTAEGGELSGLSKDEIIAKIDSADLSGVSTEDKDGISALISEMVDESKSSGGSYNPLTNLDTENSMAEILKLKGYEPASLDLFQRAAF